MPELPEVETVVAGLKTRILNKYITNARVNRHDLRNKVPESFSDSVRDKQITKITRRAKYILIHLDNKQIIIIHLGMSGRLTITSHYQPVKHDHVVIMLNDGLTIVYNDPRRFGLVSLGIHNELEKAYLNKLGPEPLSNEFNNNYLLQSLERRTQAIKPCIMNSQVVVGVGNIYACEALFLAKIFPSKLAKDLSNEEISKLVECIKHVLLNAIKAGGTTLKDYVDSNGKLGYFQNELNVYGRARLLCNVCQREIKQIKQAGRSTFFCPNCQKT